MGAYRIERRDGAVHVYRFADGEWRLYVTLRGLQAVGVLGEAASGPGARLPVGPGSCGVLPARGSPAPIAKETYRRLSPLGWVHCWRTAAGEVVAIVGGPDRTDRRGFASPREAAAYAAGLLRRSGASRQDKEIARAIRYVVQGHRDAPAR